MTQRSLWPREHGAYFQLAIPVVVACLRHTPSVAMLLITAAAGLAFVANEPLRVALGHRGRRRRAEDGRRARTHLAVLVPAAAGLGLAGLAVAPAGTITAALIVAVPVAVAIACAVRRTAHTLPGELVATVALTGASLPVQIAGGVARAAALDVWLGWSLGFAASTIAVHRVIARHKRAASLIDRACAVGLAGGLAACLVFASPGRAIAAPLIGLAAILVIAPPSAARLRAIGLTTAAVLP